MEIRAVGSDDWPVLEGLFGKNGACGGCWCMYWRLRGPAFEAGKGDGNRDAFRRLVEDGDATGVLAFRDGRAVGWCAVGPRPVFARIAAGRSFRKEPPEGTWSLNCFYVPTAERGTGVATALLEAAVDLAFQRGAAEVEGYPVIPKGEKRMPGAFVYTGVGPMFASAGFRPVEEGAKTWVRRR